MDLRHLRYFQAVAEELSFSKAAQRLNIAQPALSRAVQELEEEMGVRLIDRNRRTIRLTPGGEVLLRETGLIFEGVDDTLRKVRRTASGEDGELRLGYIGPPTRSFLGPLLKQYHQRYPRVTIVLEERTPERVWDDPAVCRGGFRHRNRARECLARDRRRATRPPASRRDDTARDGLVTRGRRPGRERLSGDREWMAAG